jgi:hypothetical protein
MTVMSLMVLNLPMYDYNEYEGNHLTYDCNEYEGNHLTYDCNEYEGNHLTYDCKEYEGNHLTYDCNEYEDRLLIITLPMTVMSMSSPSMTDVRRTTIKSNCSGSV